MKTKLALLVAVVLALGVSAHLAEQARPEVAMARAANNLLGTLETDQLTKAQFAFDDAERFNWHFIPRARKGLPLKEMNPAQRETAFALLKTGLSASGFTRAETIRDLENVLRAAEKSNSRDPELYFVSIFGNPGSATWAWRYEGHHLSQNWTIASGKAIATSPAFFGANPAEVMDGPQKGTRALPEEGDLAWALLESLVGHSRDAAVISPTAPPDIITANSRKAAIQANTGLEAGEMNPKSKGLLMSLIEAHAGTQQPALAAERLVRIKAAGFDAVRFAWMGATTRTAGAAHYYRIQGSTFLIEYDNTQNRANHQHIVWRDFKGDFGDDMLGLHYAADPGHRSVR